MYELKKKIGKVLMSKSVGTLPSSYEKRIYRAAVSRRLRNNGIGHLTRSCGCPVGSQFHLTPEPNSLWKVTAGTSE